MSTLVSTAATFAHRAHRGQVRKYTGEPYINHPKNVVQTLKYLRVTDPATLAAGWLHDVVEDTPTTLEDLRKMFGPTVAALVADLTDPVYPDKMPRAQRKACDRARLLNADPRAKLIKLADLLDNTASIAEHDPAFALIFIPEKLTLLEVLKDPSVMTLWKRAHTAAMGALLSMKPKLLVG